MENNASMFQLKDILLFILSIYLPFFITRIANTVKNYRDTIYKSSKCLEGLLTDVADNVDKVRTTVSILREYELIKKRYYGRNIKISNRKKEYFAQIIIDNLYSMRPIDTSILGCFLDTNMSENIILDIYEYNLLIYNLKEYINIKNRKSLHINNREIAGIFNFISKFLDKEEILIKSLTDIRDKLDNNTVYLQKIYKVPRICSNISIVVIIVSSIIYALTTYMFGKSIIDSKLFTNFLWTINILNALIGYTLFKYILNDK
ncbi:hypothetical protein QJR60_17255 (plasmid) [Paraclostridium sordellii]|uniref:hypothetical protein n=1 Tax=Paraclostridium sordellii TaxID=1505 RepID=UPI0030D3505B